MINTIMGEHFWLVGFKIFVSGLLRLFVVWCDTAFQHILFGVGWLWASHAHNKLASLNIQFKNKQTAVNDRLMVSQ